MIKRTFDLIFSTVGLFLLLPVLLIVASWIKLDSPGPVFFTQQRVGKNGKIFSIFKFRTMRTSSEGEGRLTVGSDPRITGAGKYLRKYKLDELPQLLNVFKGEMSLVGPRPEVPEYMDYYSSEVRDKVLSVRPGITDRASLEMIDENHVLAQYEDPRQAYIQIIMPIKQEYYLDYVMDNSVWKDIKIIVSTLSALIGKHLKR